MQQRIFKYVKKINVKGTKFYKSRYFQTLYLTNQHIFEVIRKIKDRTMD